MKKKIIAVIAFVLVVTGVPFCAIKGDEAARARAKEAAENQNKEWYKEANACIDAGEYEDAIKLLEKLPTDYEDSRYIIPYAEYCKVLRKKKKLSSCTGLRGISREKMNILENIRRKCRQRKRKQKRNMKSIQNRKRKKKEKKSRKMYHIKGWSEKIYGDLSKWQG